MAVALRKGGRVNLTKGTTLKRAMIGLGWDTNRYSGRADFDLDLVIFECSKKNAEDSKKEFKCVDEDHMIFYHNLEDPEGAIKHSGDDRTGTGDGDDETAFIEFAKISPKVDKIVIVVSIYEATKHNQNFGLVDNAFIRMVDAETDAEILRFDLGEEFSTQQSVVFAEIYKNNGEWKFRAVGEGYNCELAGLCQKYGIDAE